MSSKASPRQPDPIAPVVDDDDLIYDGPGFFEQYGKSLLGLFAAVLVALAIFAVVKLVEAKHNSEAQEALSQAVASADIIAVADKFPNTPAAAQALLLYADDRVAQKLWDDALTGYQRFIAMFPKHPLVVNAYMGLASVQLAKGNLDDALSQYLAVYSQFPATHRAGEAMINAGQIQEQRGQFDEARQSYETAKALLGNSVWRQIVDEQLSRLEQKVPRKPKPAPTVTPAAAPAPGAAPQAVSTPSPSIKVTPVEAPKDGAKK